jgi:hypothetical protein
MILGIKILVFSNKIAEHDFTASGFSIFFKCTSTSLFTDGTFFIIKIWTIFMNILYNTPSNQEVPKIILGG